MIASDFECPLRCEGRNVPAHLFIAGTKDNPQCLPSGGHISWDNSNLELDIPPQNSAESFVTAIRRTLDDARELLPSDVEIVLDSDTSEFTLVELEMPELAVFGCSPDFNAWTGRRQNPPKSLRRYPLRFAGLHLHIDYAGDPAQFVKVLELELHSFLERSEPASMRRKAYGMWGSYRPKSYGLEWRVPSSTLLRDDMMLTHLWTETAKLAAHNWGAFTFDTPNWAGV